MKFTQSNFMIIRGIIKSGFFVYIEKNVNSIDNKFQVQ